MTSSVPPMPRDEFVQQQHAAIDDTFALTSGETVVRERFERMALKTYDHLAAARVFVLPFPVKAHEGLGPLGVSKTDQKLLPSDLLRRWLAWPAAYGDLLERNPRLALHDALQCIGETHMQCSWPSDLEPTISDWIDSGRREPVPFEDRYGLLTPEFYERLRTIRRRAGGFVVSRSEDKGHTFLPEAEWQQEKLALQRKAYASQLSREARQARSAHLQRRMAEIIAEAQNDTAFWDALRSCESQRERARPPPDQEASVARTLTGPIGIRKTEATLADRASLDHPTLDPLLAAFVERVRQPTDLENDVSATVIVAFLRGTVRDELGLDGRLAREGGPSFGEA